MRRKSLTQFLVEQQREQDALPAQPRLLLSVVARACKRIGYSVNQAGTDGLLGDAGAINAQGEAQKRLDVMTNEKLFEANEWGGHLGAMASEEMDTIHPFPNRYPNRSAAMQRSIIVAVCGDSGAGKSTTTGLLKDMGFRAFSLSGLLRDEADAAFDAPSRAQVQAYGKRMQQEHGNDYFARRLVAETDLIAPGDAVIDGMRNLDEVEHIRAAAEKAGMTFVMIALVLDAERRFDRVQRRSRAGDPGDLETFKIDDARANGANGVFQNNAALVAAADIRLVNDGDIASLKNELHRALAGLRKRDGATGIHG